MKAQRRMPPVVIGPDVTGRTLVLAGDRVCWWGGGEPPLTPGAHRLRSEGLQIAGAKAQAVDLPAGDAAAIRRLLLAAVAAGNTAVLGRVVARSSEEATGCLDHAASAAASVGLRAVFGCSVGPTGIPVLEECRRFLHANQRPFLRGAVLVDARAGGEALEAAGRLQDATGIRVQPACPADPLAAVAACFGRRFGVLEPGAAGDAMVRDAGTGALRHTIVAGRLLSCPSVPEWRDGRPRA